MEIIAFCSTFSPVLSAFGGCFRSRRSFENFVWLVTGWILCRGRRSLSGMLKAGLGPQRKKHFSSFYRFLSRARWDLDALGLLLLKLVLASVGVLPYVVLLVDDTLLRRSGPHIFGAAMHYDPLRSSYGWGSGRGKKVLLAYGTLFVTLAVWVPLPWGRGVALPVLFRLYRSPKNCPAQHYRKRTELAAELVRLAVAQLGERKVYVIGDSEYACKTLVRGLPKNVHFIGPMPMNAAVYAAAEPKRGRGAKPKKGERIPPPRYCADFDGWPWSEIELPLYGQKVRLQYKTERCLWYSVARERLGTMLITHDPRGRYQDRAFFCTDAELSVELMLTLFSYRWSLEAAYRACKQELGIEEPQNGWWRRRRGKSPAAKKPGPRPHAWRGRAAVQRTVPLGMLSYGLVHLWFLQHGNAEQVVARAREEAPWYRRKKFPSFADMLEALQRELCSLKISQDPPVGRVEQQSADDPLALPRTG